MKSFRKNIRRIVRSIKQKHFTDLRRTLILFEKSTDYYMAITTLPLKFSILYVDVSCKNFNDDVLEALITHEFCHFNEDDERAVDMQVIQLGFGRGLLEFHKHHNKKYKRYKKKDGLTVKEIERFLA